MMSLQYRSLAYTDIDTLLICFNESFKVYYVPLQFTKEQLADKIYAEGIDMKMSYGAFDGEKLVAFILNAIDTINNKITAYNAGTGVLPGYRGNNLTVSLYEFCLERLKENGIERAALDVIDDNVPAKKAYVKAGLNFTRKLISYKGKTNCRRTAELSINESDAINWDIVEKLHAWEPAWQYNNGTIKRSANNYSFLTVEDNNGVQAYAVVNLKNGRIAHFGSTGERYIHELFGYLGEKLDALAVIHVEENSEANRQILSAGLQHFITSWEMDRML